MQATLFKSRYLPNADGSESTTQLTNSNTVFIHTYLGDDNTGDGTREKPYRSMTKALLKSGMTYVLFRGLINETFTTELLVVGDDVSQIMGNDYIYLCSCSRLTINKSPNKPILLGCIANVIITRGTNSQDNSYSSYSLHKKGLNNMGVHTMFIPSTALFITGITSYSGTPPVENWIVLNFHTNSYTFGHCVFLSTMKIFTGAVNYIVPNFTNNSTNNVQLLRDALRCSGDAREYLLTTFGSDNCRVIKEQRCGGITVNVFNKYDINRTGRLQAAITTGAKTSIRLITDQPAANWPTTGDIFMPTEVDYTANGVTMPIGSFEVWTYTSVTVNGANDITLTGVSYTFKTAHSNLTKTCTRYGDVLDFTLNPDTLNEALWASNTGSYVGCFRPAVDGIIDSNATFINVNPDGTDGGVGDLFQIDANEDLVFNGASSQTWNRFRDTETVLINKGSSFKGLNAMSTDGSPFGFYIGKKQNLIDATSKQPGDTLVVGQMYKIFNDLGQDVTRAIVYNGITYLPEYTFYCIQDVPTFSLLNAGTGAYVKAVNADVIESIELFPYDDATTPSTFPKFSAPLMGDCKLLFYTTAGATRYGKTAGQPVKFADLANANMLVDFPRGLNNMYLTVATTAAAATTLNVNDTTNYPTSGVVYFGTTKFTYTSKTATTLVGASQTLTAQPIGTLVNLVNRLEVNTISLYDEYAISNADREFFTLGNPNLPSPISTYFTTSIPTIKGLRREINGHFDLPYDY